jgi:hypothetical protein
MIEPDMRGGVRREINRPAAAVVDGLRLVAGLGRQQRPGLTRGGRAMDAMASLEDDVTAEALTCDDAGAGGRYAWWLLVGTTPGRRDGAGESG